MADKRIIQLPNTPGVDTATDEMVVDNATDGVRRIPVGRAGGPAILDANGKVADRLAYEGVAGGVALLDANGMPLTAANEAVVESGSNANGEWIKFADGTMICWLPNALTGITTSDYSVQGLTVKRATITWTFPQAFISTPTVSANSGRLYSAGAALGGALPSIYSANTSATSTIIVIEALVAYDEAREHGLIAIGKWK